MIINHEKTEDTLVIGVVGRLDTVTAPELETFLLDNLSGVKTLIFNLKDMEYTSSAGLRIFLKAQKLMNSQGEMIIENVQTDVMDVFEMTGFSDFLTIRW